MDLGIKDKVALVFGGGSGLGKAIATQLAEEGVKVVIAGRTDETLQQTASIIRNNGNEALPIVWDLSDLSVIENNIETIKQHFGSVDILINNTGGPPPTSAAGQAPEIWQEYFNSMVVSVIAITDQILPDMRAKGWGRIITSTSSGIISPIPGLALSNALRMSLVGWSKTLSREIGKDGITANIVLPGRISTDRIVFLDTKRAEREGRTVESINEESCTNIPLGRIGDPKEYGDVITFLASERASYVTGSVIRVDGGQIPSI